MSYPALFLDRDGTLIADPGYLRDPDEVVLLPGCAHVLREAKRRGYRLIIVSNQSGVGRGYYDEAALHRVQERVNDLFDAEGVRFDGVYFCIHAPEAGCECRKPRPGMLLGAARELDVDLARSVMIGDKISDVEAGKNAGCGSIVAIALEHADATLHAKTWPEIGQWLAARAP